MANIVTQLQNKDGDNLYPLAGGMAADSITTAMLQDDAVTSGKIADEAVTSQNIDWATMPYMPKVIASGNTSNANKVEFVASSPSHCWVVVISKGANDGTNGGVYFIRQGAKAGAIMANTGSSVSYVLSSETVSAGFKVTLTISGDMTYANYNVYEVY